MNHHRSLLRVILGSILQLETLWQVVIHLDGTQLPTTTDGILYHEVELRTIEGSLANLLTSLKTLLLASLADSILALFPNLIRTDILLCILRIAERNLCLVVLETEDLEYLQDYIDYILELRLHLIRTNEDVSIILSKCTNTSQTMELTALLIAEYGTELSDTQRKVLVRTRLTSVDLAVVRTVHWLEHILLILLRSLDRLECILAIVSIVTRCYIETLATDTWADNLLIVVRLQERTEQLLQTQAELSALWQPDRKTLSYTLREHEEFHLLTNLTVVTLLSLFENYQVLVEHLLLREADTVDTGHLLALGITAPESTCHTCNLHSLDKASVHQVRTTAKIGEIALGICGDSTILQVLLNMLALVSLTVSLELSESISLSHLLANHRFVLLGKFHHLSLNLGEIIL